MKKIHAVFEHGVFRPLETVDLADRTEVEFEPKIVGTSKHKPGSMKGIIEVMSHRYDTGEPDIAARHNVPQPSDK